MNIKLSSSQRKRIAHIITQAESNSEIGNESAKVFLGNYADDLLDLDYAKNRKVSRKLNELYELLDKAEDRTIVYQGIIPDDILTFVAEAEKAGIKAGSIFKHYAPIKELGEKSISKMKKKMYLPFGIFILASLVFSYVVGEFIPLAESGAIHFSTIATFIMNHFLLINGIYGGIFAFAFMVVPEKLPLIRKLFSEINGMLAISTMIVLNKLKYSATDMIPSLIKSFNLKKYAPSELDIAGLTKMLYQADLITDLDASDIRNSGSVTIGLEPVFLRIFKNKKESVELLDEILQEVIKNLTIFLIGVPVFMMLYIIIDLFSGVLSLM